MAGYIREVCLMMVAGSITHVNVTAKSQILTVMEEVISNIYSGAKRVPTLNKTIKIKVSFYQLGHINDWIHGDKFKEVG